MTISLKHTTQAVGTDAGNGEIRKTQWNEEHTLTLATAKILGRLSAGTGPAEEIGVTGTGTNLVTDSNPVIASPTYIGGGAMTGRNFPTIQNSANSALQGPVLLLDRNNASPAASDLLGFLSFTGRNASGGGVNYGYIYGQVGANLTAGAETGQLRLGVSVAGTIADLIILRGDQGDIRFSGPITPDQGIAFPATQFSAAGANTLDDYEEGTFTPRIDGTTTAGAGTYSVQVGRYTKIGDRVSVNGTITWSAHTGTGNMVIANLPFLSQNTANALAPVALSFSNLTFAAALHGYVGPNASTVTLLTAATGAAEAALPIDTAATLRFSAVYETAT